MTPRSDGAPAIPDSVGVFVKFTGASDLRAAGLAIDAVFGDETTPFRIVTGVLALDDADALAAVPHVIRIEMGRPVYPDLDVSTVEINAKPLHSGSSPLTGANVVVGIIDSGFDYRHHAFRFSGGGSRVLNIWDQSLTVRAQRPGDPFQEAAPPEFPTVGVEYTQGQIDQAIGASAPSTWCARSTTRRVTARTSRASPRATAARRARSRTRRARAPTPTSASPPPPPSSSWSMCSIRTSSRSAEPRTSSNAVRYIFIRASQLDNGAGRPCVINISQGDNLGPHDGTSLVEQTIDLELAAPRRAVVKSAGNEGAANHHAMSETPIPAGGSLPITFSVPAGDMTNRHMECWYNGITSLDVTLRAPGVPPTVSNPVHPGVTAPPFITNPLATAANQVPATITSSDLVLDNGDKQITVDFAPPAGVAIPNGTYTITFTNTGTAPATVHCWLNRSASGEATPVFTNHRTRSHTISIPGTAASVITVASYAAEKFTTKSGAITDVGNLADSSSRGPTRTGGQKPDIAAPGVAITAARANSVAGCCCDCCYTFYVDKNGTSMAAPHVAGVIALMFQRNRTLDTAAIRTALTSTARNPTGLALPNFDWGFGKSTPRRRPERQAPCPAAGRTGSCRRQHLSGSALAGCRRHRSCSDYSASRNWSSSSRLATCGRASSAVISTRCCASSTPTAPGRVLTVERAFHVAGRNVRFAFVGDGVHQYRRLGDVREQDELVLLADLGEKSEYRHPLLFGHPVAFDHLVYRPERIGQDPRQPLAIHVIHPTSHRC